MNQHWFYAVSRERKGPVGQNELREMFARGELPPETLVWCKGMDTWRPAGEAPEFRPAWHPAEAPGASSAAGYAVPEPTLAYSTANVEAPDAGPWRRFAARTVDVMLFSTVAAIVLQALGFEPVGQLQQLMVGFTLLALAVPAEALVIAGFGRTPGKALLGITLSDAHGPLSFATALKRSVRVWVMGLGMGLPLVSLLAPLLSYLRLSSRGFTAWDEALGVRVEAESLSVARTAVAVGIVGGILALAVLGTIGAVAMAGGAAP